MAIAPNHATPTTQRPLQAAARWLWALVCVVAVGCGSGSPYDYVPVSGQVTYDDGSRIPLGGMRLVFIPQNAPDIPGASPRQAMANVDAEGKFACATTYKYGDGLIPGKHKVVIQADSQQAGLPVLPRSVLGPGTTELVVDTNDQPLRIVVPKP